VEELLNAGHQVTVFDNLTEGHRAAVDGRARFVAGCLSDAGLVKRAVSEAGSEAVLHFAANALVGESMSNPGKYFGNNVAAGLNLLNAAVEARVRKFVFSSTCATYGPPDRVPMTEDLPQRPINPYGESKLMFEKMLLWYEQIHKLEFVAFRYFNAAGASEKFGEHHRIETHLIPNVLKVALGQAKQCEIYGTDYPTPDGTCIRDYIHIVDLAQAHILGLAPGKRGFYNLGNGDGYSVRQVIESCEKITGQRIPAVEKPRRPGDPPRLVAAAEKAFAELGWRPQFPKLEEIVATAWRWHQAHPYGYPD
jgi:UDP-glucose 4-epimerase